MSREHHYRVGLFWAGSAHGATTTYQSYSREYAVEIEGKPTLRGSADAAFRGDPTLHNPEDLLVAALSSCHMLSYLSHAARAGLSVVGYSDSAVGTMILDQGGGRFSDVLLLPRVILAPGADAGLAGRLHEAAHRDCFIAKSVNFPVRHEATIVMADG